MGSTFGGLEIGKRGLVTHQTALHTTGHNIANADNKNYSRQRVELGSMQPLYEPSLNRAATAGQIGQGVQIDQIRRIRDSFFDDQIISAETAKNWWEARQLYLSQMENIFNEPSDNTLRSLMDRFWSSWQELANFPASLPHREVVLEQGEGLVTRINDIYNKLSLLRQRANREIVTDVEQLNSLAGEIRTLNERILKLQVLGDNPNDLLDRRDSALEKLSKLANIRVGRDDSDELIVFIGEQVLLQGEIQRRLQVRPNAANEGMVDILWEHNEKTVILNSGRLHGLLEVRDKSITERIDAIDSYAVNIADIVNEVHKDGFGINEVTNKNFFHIDALSPNVTGSFVLQNNSADWDLDRDGTADVTAVFRVSGKNKIDADRRLGVEGNLTFFKNDRQNSTVTISYNADETLHDVIERINNSEAGVAAYINHDNQLALKATVAEDDRQTNFMIRHLEDSGELLVGYAGILTASGAAGAFDFRRNGELIKFQALSEDISLTTIFHPAAHIKIADDIGRVPGSIAAARGKELLAGEDYSSGNGKLDGSNALMIAAALKQEKRMINHENNAEEFYNSLIARLGTASRTAEDTVQNYLDDLVKLNSLRQSVMGVSLDEEMSNMVQFQHSYNASARMINTINEMLDVIINRMGV